MRRRNIERICLEKTQYTKYGDRRNKKKINWSDVPSYTSVSYNKDGSATVTTTQIKISSMRYESGRRINIQGVYPIVSEKEQNDKLFSDLDIFGYFDKDGRYILDSFSEEGLQIAKKMNEYNYPELGNKKIKKLVQ